MMPGNLQSFASESVSVPADPDLPENQRDVQFTVNGQFQPELKLKPGQTEIWSLANISDVAYLLLQLTETATGRHPVFRIVGQDGNPFTRCSARCRVTAPAYGPAGSRYAIAVTMPATGDLVLSMPPLPGAKPVVNPGILYTNNQTPNAPAVLGTNTVDPAYISFSTASSRFPVQTILHVTPERGQGPDHGLRDRPGPRRHLVRRHVGPDAGRHPGTHGHRWLRQQPGEQRRPEGVRLRVRQQHLPQHSADPAPGSTRSRGGSSTATTTNTRCMCTSTTFR